MTQIDKFSYWWGNRTTKWILVRSTSKNVIHENFQTCSVIQYSEIYEISNWRRNWASERIWIKAPKMKIKQSPHSTNKVRQKCETSEISNRQRNRSAQRVHIQSPKIRIIIFPFLDKVWSENRKALQTYSSITKVRSELQVTPTQFSWQGSPLIQFALFFQNGPLVAL
jgi:hypothetical protein